MSPFIFTLLDVKLTEQLAVYLKNDILTPAALECTQKLIALNEGHYTAWSFRRKILFALKAHLEEEMQFIDDFTAETPKNYQLWQHRQVILERLSSPHFALTDLRATRLILTGQDAKNIHCWQYRQWLIGFFGLLNEVLEEEYQFVDELLAVDVYNNSAWNHRAFLFSSQHPTGKVSKSEVDWCFAKLTDTTADNECFWNYLFFLAKPSNPDIWSRLESVLGPVEESDNWLYWRFALLTEQKDSKAAYERLIQLRPLNRSLWLSLSK